MMNVLKLFKEQKALLSGHFLLSSGLHSDKYVQCAKVLQYPNLAEQLAKALMARGSWLVARSKIDVVVSPAIGGLVIGQEIARQLKTRAIFCERENGKMELRRGFEIKKNEKCLIAEDVITTGSSTNEVIEVVKEAGGKIAGKIAIIDRSPLKNFAVSLLKLKIKAYEPENCPLCKKKIPLIKPGSKPR